LILFSIKIYSNAKADKSKILKDNTNKSGIYMWTNNINGKQYIGSFINLRIRFLQYFNTNCLIRDNSMQICRALLKHDYSNFSLTILEYCSPEKCVEREDHYFCSLPHEYNILPKAGSSLGHKHFDETKTKISDSLKGNTHSDDTKKKYLILWLVILIVKINLTLNK
jgi:group I intron endonuclease